MISKQPKTLAQVEELREKLQNQLEKFVKDFENEIPQVKIDNIDIERDYSRKIYDMGPIKPGPPKKPKRNPDYDKIKSVEVSLSIRKSG